MSRIFVDSNIWVYLFTNEDNDKCQISERFISDSGNKNTLVISYQVINEVTNVLYRKKFKETDIKNVIVQLAKICIVQDYSKEIALMASEIREAHSFSFWDSNIVASAITAQCNVLASEDMRDGQIINGVTIWNIY